MNVLEQNLPVLVMLALQTVAFAWFLGKLTQTVADLKSDINGLKNSVVYRDTFDSEIRALRDRVGQLEEWRKSI